MEASKELTRPMSHEAPMVQDEGEFALLLDSAKFHQAWQVAKLFAASKLVPSHFQGSPENVFVALHMALRLQVDPMMLMQNTYMINGRPGMEAKLVLALVNARGPFTGPIQWKFEKDGGRIVSCTAYATHAKTGELCEAAVTWDMVEAEGWSKKPGSKWQTMPELMFRYRSAAFLARLYCPEVIMGLNTVDELEDLDWQIRESSAATTPNGGSEDSDPPPVVDTLKVEEFHRLAAELDQEALAAFLEATAGSLKMTVEQVQEKAADNFGKFVQSFERWKARQKNAKTTKSQKEPLTQKQNAKTASPEQLEQIEKLLPEKAKRDGWDNVDQLRAELHDWHGVTDLGNLTSEQAAEVIAWLEK